VGSSSTADRSHGYLHRIRNPRKTRSIPRPPSQSRLPSSSRSKLSNVISSVIPRRAMLRLIHWQTPCWDLSSSIEKSIIYWMIWLGTLKIFEWTIDATRSFQPDPCTVPNIEVDPPLLAWPPLKSDTSVLYEYLAVPLIPVLHPMDKTGSRYSAKQISHE
jgi:hypothetical protein